MEAVKLISVTPDAERTLLYVARVSSNQANDDPGLIRYLIRHRHWSPFEQAHAVLEFNTSRAIAAQLLRHRSFSFQEFSQRYASPERALVHEARKPARTNRQSSLEPADPVTQAWWRDAQRRHFADAFALYNAALQRGVARECARFVLPLATETKLYVSGTLRSWIHYLEQRCDEHTQREHRDLALRARDLLSEHFPATWEALGWR